MRNPTSRVEHLATTDRRHEFIAVVEGVLPEVNRIAEQMAIYLLLAAFWGIVLYIALMAL